jgi:hypothetical protein
MAGKNRELWDSVNEAIDRRRTLTVKTVTYLPRERAHIDAILGAFLEASGMQPLRNKLGYCVHELAGNAKKANTKRLYFKDNGLKIDDPADYARGMAGFKQEMVDRVAHYEGRLKDEGLYVKFQFRAAERGVYVNVRNNVELTDFEKIRIDQKLAIAQRYACLADAYAMTEDGAEGAGLGIVMMMFMLKNLGFGTDSFSMSSAHGETVATLTLSTPQSAASVTA